MTRHTTDQLRAMADELQALWEEESMRDDNPAKGAWSPDGLRALADMRDGLVIAAGLRTERTHRAC